MSDEQVHDPLNFMRNMWGNMGFSLPGMVAPTFDVDELDKRIKDMKAVEGWLRMNLSMLQMTIQGLEMQRTTVSAVQTMGKMASDAAKSMTPEALLRKWLRRSRTSSRASPTPAKKSLSDAAMWPWQMMQQMREQMQQHAEAAAQAAMADGAGAAENEPQQGHQAERARRLLSAATRRPSRQGQHRAERRRRNQPGDAAPVAPMRMARM